MLLLDGYALKLQASEGNEEAFSILVKDVFSGALYRKKFTFVEFAAITSKSGLSLSHSQFMELVDKLSKNDEEAKKYACLSVKLEDKGALLEMKYKHYIGHCDIRFYLPSSVAIRRSDSEEAPVDVEATIEQLLKQKIYILEQDLKKELRDEFLKFAKESEDKVEDEKRKPDSPEPMPETKHRRAISDESLMREYSPNSEAEDLSREVDKPLVSEGRPNKNLRRSLSVDVLNVNRTSKMDSRIVSASSDGNCCIYSLNENKLLHKLTGTGARIEALEAKKSHVVAAGQDGQLKIWSRNSAHKDKSQTIEAHLGAIWDMKFVGNRIASASADKTIKLWDLDTGKCHATLNGHKDGIPIIRYKHDTFASGSYDHSIKVWDLETGSCITTLEGHTGGIRDFDFESWRLISCSDDKTIKSWDIRSGKCINEIAKIRVLCMKLCDYGCILSGDDNLIRVMDMESNNFTMTLKGHTSKVVSLDFANDLIATGGWDSTIRIWDILTGKCKHLITDHREKVRVVKFMNDNTLVSGSDDATIKVFDTMEGNCTETLSYHKGPVRFISFIQ